MSAFYYCPICENVLATSVEEFRNLTSCPFCEIPINRTPTQEETTAALQRAKLRDEESIEIGPGARWEDCVGVRWEDIVLTEVDDPFAPG